MASAWSSGSVIPFIGKLENDTRGVPMSDIGRIAAACLCIVGLSGLAGHAVAQQKTQDNDDNVKVSTYQDWEVRCPKSGDKDECEMTQLVNNPDSGKPIMRVVLGYPPQIDSAAMIFILPLGTRLSPGVKVGVDGDQIGRFPFQICMKEGCRADFPVEGKALNKLKRGGNATVSIVGPEGDDIDLKISLQGFTAANKAISNQ